MSETTEKLKQKPLLIVAAAVTLAVIVITLVLLGVSNQKESVVYDINVCWNKVIEYDRGAVNAGNYYWPSGCRGEKTSTGTFCTQALIGLTTEETADYEMWKKAGKVVTSGCE